MSSIVLSDDLCFLRAWIGSSFLNKLVLLFLTGLCYTDDGSTGVSLVYFSSPNPTVKFGEEFQLIVFKNHFDVESLRYLSSLKAKVTGRIFLNLKNYVGSHVCTAPCSFDCFDSPPLSKVRFSRVQLEYCNSSGQWNDIRKSDSNIFCT